MKLYVVCTKALAQSVEKYDQMAQALRVARIAIMEHYRREQGLGNVTLQWISLPDGSEVQVVVPPTVKIDISKDTLDWEFCLNTPTLRIIQLILARMESEMKRQSADMMREIFEGEA